MLRYEGLQLFGQMFGGFVTPEEYVRANREDLAGAVERDLNDLWGDEWDVADAERLLSYLEEIAREIEA